MESINRRIVTQASWGIKQDPILKISKLKRDEGMAQMVECHPSKCEALNSPLAPHKIVSCIYLSRFYGNIFNLFSSINSFIYSEN
jgi:hypothetical protein